jgi:hypothetical protein
VETVRKCILKIIMSMACGYYDGIAGVSWRAVPQRRFSDTDADS